jgi:anti-sigma regulatory factor (Ser/Thr protein kinase)
MKGSVPATVGERARTFFSVTFPSTFEAMGKALEGAVSALRAQGWIASKDEPCTRLCLEEALVNAIRHGNKGDESAEVRLEMEEAGECCTIRVYDQGTGFRPEAVQMPDTGQLGGRGVCLMRHYMERVVYDQAQRCLALSFRRKSHPPEGASTP